MFFLHVNIKPTLLAREKHINRGGKKVFEKCVWKHFMCLVLKKVCCALKSKASNIGNAVLEGTQLGSYKPWWKIGS